jgi:purine-binding chemotaxis protein CheW
MSENLSSQYLTFVMDGDTFAVNIQHVREVVEYTDVTRIPRTPAFMRGVINLRGGVLPIIDLRLKFDLPAKETDRETSIIITEINLEGEIVVIGTMVDAVKEVVEFSSEDLEPAPKIGLKLDSDHIKAMAKQEDRFVIVLNVDSIFSVKEISFARTVGEEGGDRGAVSATEETAE